jgi:hypothetical protein
MELHLAAGRPDGARRAFEALEARLRDLDLVPSDKSRRLASGVGA